MTIQNDDTNIVGGQGSQAVPPAVPTYGAKPKKKGGDNTWRNAAIGAGVGVVAGGGAAFAMDAIPSSDDVQAEVDETRPDWAVGDIKVASGVNDDMSFNEAFAAARAEVGPGGAFEWHGQVYGTYTASEWNHMSAAERAEFNSHFDWNNADHSSYAHNDTHHHDVHHYHHTEVHHYESAHVSDVNDDPEVEVLGVVHDDETGANYGGMTIDGQEVILVDVDGNLTFDYMAGDFNQNGVIEDHEIVDISGQHITVNDLGGFSDGSHHGVYDDGMNDGPDYTAGIPADVAEDVTASFTPEIDPVMNDDFGTDAGMDFTADAAPDVDVDIM